MERDLHNGVRADLKIKRYISFVVLIPGINIYKWRFCIDLLWYLYSLLFRHTYWRYFFEHWLFIFFFWSPHSSGNAAKYLKCYVNIFSLLIKTDISKEKQTKIQKPFGIIVLMVFPLCYLDFMNLIIVLD